MKISNLEKWWRRKWYWKWSRFSRINRWGGNAIGLKLFWGLIKNHLRRLTIVRICSLSLCPKVRISFDSITYMRMYDEHACTPCPLWRTAVKLYKLTTIEIHLHDTKHLLTLWEYSCFKTIQFTIIFLKGHSPDLSIKCYFVKTKITDLFSNQARVWHRTVCYSKYRGFRGLWLHSWEQESFLWL